MFFSALEDSDWMSVFCPSDGKKLSESDSNILVYSCDVVFFIVIEQFL